MQHAKSLKKGSKIAAIAPASPFEKEAFLCGLEKLQALDLEITYRDDIFDSHQVYLAGNTERRFHELKDALLDPEIDACFIARGGFGSAHLLPLLDQIQTYARSKILLGYSDFTSLLNYFIQRHNWVTFHGPCIAKDFSNLADDGLESLKENLFSTKPLGKKTYSSLLSLTPELPESEGPIVGGCLSILCSSLGTPYQIQTAGKILYLEDINEKAYALDRMLWQLRLSGVLKGVKGFVFGPLQGAHKDELFVKKLLHELLKDLEVPILYGYPSGHQNNSLTLPFGVKTRINNQEASVEFLEAALEE